MCSSLDCIQGLNSAVKNTNKLSCLLVGLVVGRMVRFVLFGCGLSHIMNSSLARVVTNGIRANSSKLGADHQVRLLEVVRTRRRTLASPTSEGRWLGEQRGLLALSFLQRLESEFLGDDQWDNGP